jgi:hypothetical protein
VIQPKRSSVDPRLGTITPDQLRQYLRSLGLKRRPYGRPGVEAFVGPTDMYGTELLVLFPQSQDAPDYLYSLAHVLDTLTGWEDRPESEIVTDILNLPKQVEEQPAPGSGKDPC